MGDREIGPVGDVPARRTSARKFDPVPAGEVGVAASGRRPAPRPPTPARRMPAEWEEHEATWIAWPHHEPDWPGKLGPIPWVYAEIVRVLHAHERVEILCHDAEVRDAAR